MHFLMQLLWMMVRVVQGDLPNVLCGMVSLFASRDMDATAALRD
jgi:hypothetical protein